MSKSKATRSDDRKVMSTSFLTSIAHKYSESLTKEAETRNMKVLSMINSPPPAARKIITQAALIDKTPIFCLNGELVKTVHKKWLAVLATCAMNTVETSVPKWMSLLLSFLYALFPNIIDYSHASNRVISMIPVAKNAEFIERLKTLTTHYRDDVDGGVAYYSSFLAIIDDMFPEIARPSQYLPEPVGGGIGYVLIKIETLAWYGYLGALAFCITKNATEGRTTSFEDSRFKAIRSKYSLNLDQAPILAVGKAAPSEHGLRMFHSSWKRLPLERTTFISYIVRSAVGGAGEAEEAVYTTVRLMKWGDLTHFVLITQLLSLYPWVREIREWRGELLAFDAAAKQMYLMCPELRDMSGVLLYDDEGQVRRDTTEMPFLKVKMGDTGDIGKANTMPMLSYIARQALVELQPTLNNYIIAVEYPDEWEVFETMKAAVEGRITVTDQESGKGKKKEE